MAVRSNKSVNARRQVGSWEQSGMQIKNGLRDGKSGQMATAWSISKISKGRQLFQGVFMAATWHE
eukprot:1162034-Pelagomonas_calceolata.AAC.12